MFQTMVRAVGADGGRTVPGEFRDGTSQAAGAGRQEGVRAYDVQFAFGDTTYSGKMTLAIVKGTVSGSMAIDTPTTVTGEVAGTLSNSKLALDYPYHGR